MRVCVCVSYVSNGPSHSHSIAVQSCILSTSCSYRWPAVWLCFLSQGQLVPSICSQNFTMTISHVFTLLLTANTANQNTFAHGHIHRSVHCSARENSNLLFSFYRPDPVIPLPCNYGPTLRQCSWTLSRCTRLWKLWFTNRVYIPPCSLQATKPTGVNKFIHWRGAVHSTCSGGFLLPTPPHLADGKHWGPLLCSLWGVVHSKDSGTLLKTECLIYAGLIQWL